jgi:hypothetical protein
VKRKQVARKQRELAVRDAPPGPTAYDEFIVVALETWARHGKRPKRPKRFEISPEIADVVLGHLSAKSIVVQSRALDRAIAPEAGPHEIDTGAMVARNILDRRLGKPVERVMTASKVHITFEGLQPDVFPQKEREAQAEVTEIPGNLGTEVDDDGDD